MMTIKSAVFLVAAVGCAVGTPAAAQSGQVESQKVRPTADPNQKICQDITVVGSRLATRRICATRAEWAAKKKDDRETVDAIQRNPCILDTNGQCGSH
ncbi:MAG: hypothetical protein ABI853_06395 [Sphingomicrobium sp.]